MNSFCSNICDFINEDIAFKLQATYITNQLLYHLFTDAPLISFMAQLKTYVFCSQKAMKSSMMASKFSFPIEVQWSAVIERYLRLKAAISFAVSCSYLAVGMSTVTNSQVELQLYSMIISCP